MCRIYVQSRFETDSVEAHIYRRLFDPIQFPHYDSFFRDFHDYDYDDDVEPKIAYTHLLSRRDGLCPHNLCINILFHENRYIKCDT